MGKRAQRIPSWPGVIHSNKGRIHLRRPTCDILTFRLRRSGGPYIATTAEKMISYQVCWRMRRWHNGRTRRSLNPKSEIVLRDCSVNGEESAAHSILARSDPLQQRPYTFAQTNLWRHQISLAARRRTIHSDYPFIGH